MAPPPLDPNALTVALHADGPDTLMDLLIQPRASRGRVLGVHDGRLKVAVAAPPVDGAANKALVHLMAKALGVGRGAVSIERGASGRRKRLRVRGLTPAQVVAVLVG